ncbi:hypothetical protein GRAQ_03379 [Rahnella aquatilis CIP 78.65 = ATCC 33071]|uniref:DUF4062 domain-containing protein n=1 Tax=Rahnella aquatilis (strain ATCC 33071 / DSM 4594 / JCM 1683 / NBRC 105701 / NCIMB 13365 / CIP 78.65) TaxID=745277 RepID=H2IW65_RAHAC|nr:DUF4062 domain-containing protein [Rahnella aquatilis]AEX50734.1 hypothetical protein Rahaq2_0824 [Rahnella aquatilis CIP 78.65 = ATCC 33071]KFD01765.1 hypothetical protein GRAQ_03379 [Rahnella aquatilis CIP 78.65 = ATCC 33071]
MDKRYQVFVSSTFTDLKDERSNVIQTLMEMDCIPAGMELFPAIDEEQWEFIKKIIDDCDYYLLIIGGRYGSVAEDGLSYTEKEFDYAVSKGIKIIVLTHENRSELPVSKSEINEELVNKLELFIEKASKGRLRKTWSTAKDLPGLVALSMTKTIKTYPAVGWVRANSIGNESDLREMIKLQKDYEILKNELIDIKNNNIKFESLNLVGIESVFKFTCKSYYTAQQIGRAGAREWNVEMSWRDIFYTISPYLSEYTAESKVSNIIVEAAQRKLGKGGTTPSVISQDLKTIGIQLQAYGLISIKSLKTTAGSMALFWILTDSGKSEMLKLRTIKNEPSQELDQ